MSDTQTARLRELDRTTNAVETDPTLTDDLFAVVGFLETEPAVRRHLSDPSTPEQARKELIGGLFAGRVGSGAIRVVTAASSLRWGDGLTLTGSLERQGVRAIMIAADRDGQLDAVEAQLFDIASAVRGSVDLSAALANRSRPLAQRQALLRGLIGGQALPAVEKLAERAVSARRRTFELTIDSYLAIAAEQRQRGIAKIRVARPMTADQTTRLRSVLMRQAGRPLTLEITVDPDLLGGVRVLIGDEVIEGTVSSRLEEARRAFA